MPRDADLGFRWTHDFGGPGGDVKTSTQPLDEDEDTVGWHEKDLSSQVNANAPPVFAPPCEMAGLDNVTLIIHCSEQELCYARRLLLQDYFLYFRHVAGL